MKPIGCLHFSFKGDQFSVIYTTDASQVLKAEECERNVLESDAQNITNKINQIIEEKEYEVSDDTMIEVNLKYMARYADWKKYVLKEG